MLFDVDEVYVLFIAYCYGSHDFEIILHKVLKCFVRQRNSIHFLTLQKIHIGGMNASRVSSIFILCVAGCLLQPTFSLATSFDINTQQIINSADLSAGVNIFSQTKFKLLEPPDRCLHRNLTRCHINGEKYFNYYDYCYSDDCSWKDYYCLNKQNDNTVHICGKSDKCQKREYKLL